MPLTLSNAQRREMDSRRSADPYLWLVTFTHPDVDAPIRVARNGEAVVSQGVTFEKGWFDLEAPTDNGEPPRGRITVPNIDRSVSSMLLALRYPPRVRLQAVLASDPDTIIEDYDFLYIRGIEGDAETVSGSLDSWNFTGEPWPARGGTQDRFPGLFL
jgi:hypothetical protein